jgi:hypothetical protein
VWHLPADLCTEAELAAVAELRQGVPQSDSTIDAGEEPLRSLGILGHNGIGMRAMARDVRTATTVRNGTFP